MLNPVPQRKPRLHQHARYLQLKQHRRSATQLLKAVAPVWPWGAYRGNVGFAQRKAKPRDVHTKLRYSLVDDRCMRKGNAPSAGASGGKVMAGLGEQSSPYRL